jgi:two-component system sensor histidine kinase ChvG
MVLGWKKPNLPDTDAERVFIYSPFSSMLQGIVILNLLGFVILVAGIAYLNPLRDKLITAKVNSLLVQGGIIAAAIAASATADTDKIIINPEAILELQSGQETVDSSDVWSGLEFPVNPERAAPILRRMIDPVGVRALIYGEDGFLVLDSDTLYAHRQVIDTDLPPPVDHNLGYKERFVEWLKSLSNRLRLLLQSDLPVYDTINVTNGLEYPEIMAAFSGVATPIVRINENHEQIVSVAVPVQRMRAVLGVLLLSTRGGEIDDMVTTELWGVVKVASIAFTVMLLLSFLLHRTMAVPMRKLSSAAEKVRKSIKAREEIPDFTHRHDEIGHLSGAFKDMTLALYGRLDAIERFAADVAHELKNPLASLRSAINTLQIAKKEEDRKELIRVINHDIKRLDRLITDISDASRLDAELAKGDRRQVDISDVVADIVNNFKDRIINDDVTIKPLVKHQHPGCREDFYVAGHKQRLGQVITNIIDNAISFSPKTGTVRITLLRKGGEVKIIVEDEGPGIQEEYLEKVFRRFYTDRHGDEDFGNNSGLGLSIAQQIVLAHKGRIWAENSTVTGGARFVVHLPASYDCPPRSAKKIRRQG